MSSTSTQKPQIFINNVDQTISEETISKACEEICKNKPSSVILRPSHDKKNNLCVITLSSEAEAETLLKAGSIVANNITLKVEQYQAQFPNLFLKNEDNRISEHALQEGLRALIKGNFHVYYGSGYVSFFIQEEDELAKLVSEPKEIKGILCTFKKYVASSTKKEKNHLFLRFQVNQKGQILPTIQDQIIAKFGPIEVFQVKEPKNDTFTISIIFQESKNAEQLFAHIEAEKNILFGYPVNVSWKKQDEVESEDKMLFVKCLDPRTTEEALKKLFSAYGEIISIDLQTLGAGKDAKKHAILHMNSATACIEAMSKAVFNKDIRNLFINQIVQVTPYIPKIKQEALSKATYIGKPKLNVNAQPIQTQPSQYVVNQSLPQQQQVTVTVGQAQLMQVPPLMQQQPQNMVSNQLVNPYINQQLAYQQYQQILQAQYYYQQYPGQQQRRFNNNNHYQNNSNFIQAEDINFYPATANKQKNKNHNNNYYRQKQYQQNNPMMNTKYVQQAYYQSFPQQQQFQQQQFPQGSIPTAQQYTPQQQVNRQQPHKNEQQISQEQVPSQRMTLAQMQAQAKTSQGFQSVVIPNLKQLIEKELNTRYPENVNSLDQVLQMLTDEEVLTVEEIVNLNYNATELKSRVDEAIELIKSSQ